MLWSSSFLLLCRPYTQSLPVLLCLYLCSQLVSCETCLPTLQGPSLQFVTRSARVGASPLSLRVVARKRGLHLKRANHGDALKHVILGDISPSRCAARRRAQRIERPERCSSTSFFSKSRIKNKNVADERSKTSKIVKFRPESAAAFVFFCDFFLFICPSGGGHALVEQLSPALQTLHPISSCLIVPVPVFPASLL
jgi:hypothetical protein